MYEVLSGLISRLKCKQKAGVGTPFLKCCNLLFGPLPVVKMKLQLRTSSITMLQCACLAADAIVHR